jgi:hypothetical protein
MVLSLIHPQFDFDKSDAPSIMIVFQNFDRTLETKKEENSDDSDEPGVIKNEDIF